MSRCLYLALAHCKSPEALKTIEGTPTVGDRAYSTTLGGSTMHLVSFATSFVSILWKKTMLAAWLLFLFPASSFPTALAKLP